MKAALFDTHAHFSRLGGEFTLEALVTRAREVGVARIVAVGGSCDLNKAAVDAATAYPDLLRVALGFDRDQVKTLASPDARRDALERTRSAIHRLPSQGVQVCAIGEIGLDYFYTPESASEQLTLFREQLALANELGLPVIIHSRDAVVDTLEALEDHARAWRGDPTRIGVLHCFTGDEAFAADLLELGYHISFSGIVTFLNADSLREVAKGIPDASILIETDTPYLAPAPMRGKRNEPAFVKHVAERLAELRGVTFAEFAEQTFNSASHLFGW